MNRVLTCFASLFLISFGALRADQSPTKIHWHTNYNQALKNSSETNKPVLLFFTGSDWCVWCKKLDSQVFHNQSFINLAADKYIFVMLDFPSNHTLSPQETAQNKLLQQKYAVRGYPTVVLIDANENQIGKTGYREGGGKAYADHLEKLVNDHQSYQGNMDQLEKKKLATAELKIMYTRAKDFGRTSDQAAILANGVKNEDNLFFLIERYRTLVDAGRIQEDETLLLRKNILDNDPNNQQLTHYQVAIIDFEASYEQLEQNEFTPELAVAPLISYIDQYHSKDPDHIWRLEMIISQVYFDKGKLSEALQYAKASYHAAPEPARAEIAMAIRNIESQIEIH